MSNKHSLIAGSLSPLPSPSTASFVLQHVHLVAKTGPQYHILGNHPVLGDTGEEWAPTPWTALHETKFNDYSHFKGAFDVPVRELHHSMLMYKLVKVEAKDNFMTKIPFIGRHVDRSKVDTEFQSGQNRSFRLERHITDVFVFSDFQHENQYLPSKALRFFARRFLHDSSRVSFVSLEVLLRDIPPSRITKDILGDKSMMKRVSGLQLLRLLQAASAERMARELNSHFTDNGLRLALQQSLITDEAVVESLAPDKAVETLDRGDLQLLSSLINSSYSSSSGSKKNDFRFVVTLLGLEQLFRSEGVRLYARPPPPNLDARKYSAEVVQLAAFIQRCEQVLHIKETIVLTAAQWLLRSAADAQAVLDLAASNALVQRLKEERPGEYHLTLQTELLGSRGSTSSRTMLNFLQGTPDTNDVIFHLWLQLLRDHPTVPSLRNGLRLNILG